MIARRRDRRQVRLRPSGGLSPHHREPQARGPQRNYRGHGPGPIAIRRGSPVALATDSRALTASGEPGRGSRAGGQDRHAERNGTPGPDHSPHARTRWSPSMPVGGLPFGFSNARTSDQITRPRTHVCGSPVRGRVVSGFQVLGRRATGPRSSRSPRVAMGVPSMPWGSSVPRDAA